MHTTLAITFSKSTVGASWNVLYTYMRTNKAETSSDDDYHHCLPRPCQD